jgi:DNA-binding IclR family transcriptional regulator
LNHHSPSPASEASTQRPLVPAVARAAALLDALARERQPMSMARLAERLALPRSSVHGLCNTLHSLGYLRRQDDGAFAIGPQVLHLAEAFMADTDVTREFDALWRASEQPPEETLLLSTLDGSDVIYLSARNGTRPLGLAFARGSRLPAHLAATGRAMLAFADPDQVRQLLGRGRLPRLTAHGPASVDALLAELAPYRRSGCSVDDENIRLGVYCMASPVFDAAGRVVAGVGVCLSKPSCTAAEVKRQRQRVIDTARALTARLGGDWAECVRAAQQTEVS